MKVELQCGDTITIPEGCKAIVKDGSVVFEKEEKEEKKEQEFKDGDVLVDDYKAQPFLCKIIMIYKGIKSEDGCYECYILRNSEGGLAINDNCCNTPRARVRSATEEEKEQLFDAMKERGLQWNAEAKRVENIRWRIKEGDKYHYIFSTLEVSDTIYYDSDVHRLRVENYNYFRTIEQAEEAARRMKETLRKYHEEIGE